MVFLGCKVRSRMFVLATCIVTGTFFHFADLVNEVSSTYVAELAFSHGQAPQWAKREIVALREPDHEAQTTTFESFDEASSTPFVGFYHIYVGKDGGPSQALNVTKEQLSDLKESYAVEGNPYNKTFTLYYNTVGSRANLDTNRIEEMCNRPPNKMRCIHMRHYDGGFEEITLRDMQQFCESFPKHRVMYFHNKGSFHPSTMNDRWRKYMMQAISSEQCLETTIDQCHACGLSFSPIWGFFFPGNFYDAHCSYITRLPIPNAKYEVKLRKIGWTNRHPKLKQRYTHDLEPFTVIGRYAFEHWIGVHPELRACDVAESPDLYWYVDSNRERFGYEIPKIADFARFAPRFPVDSPFIGIDDKRMKNDLKTEPMAEINRELMFLAGHLLRWRQVYGEGALPPDNSWIWDYFPDGHNWRQVLKSYTTLEAIEIMTDVELREAFLASLPNQ